MSSPCKPFTIGALRNFACLFVILVLAVLVDSMIRFLVTKGWFDPNSFPYYCVTSVTKLIEFCDSLLLSAIVLRHTWDGVRSQLRPAEIEPESNQIEEQGQAPTHKQVRARSPQTTARPTAASPKHAPDPETERDWILSLTVVCLATTVGVLAFEHFDLGGPTDRAVITLTTGVWIFCKLMLRRVLQRRDAAPER
jgi:hypothetical protein